MRTVGPTQPPKASGPSPPPAIARPLVRGSLLLLTALAPDAAPAQVGRGYVSAEAYAGLARVVYVGQIVELGPVEYGGALTFTQKLGKPHRLVFEVAETIRGNPVESLELVLSLQGTYDLEYMRDHSLEILLVGGPNRLDSTPRPRVGIEAQGQRVEGEWYQFRLLDAVETPGPGEGGKSPGSSTGPTTTPGCSPTNSRSSRAGRRSSAARAPSP